MANISYPTRIISAHGTAQEWSTADPILNLGEIGVATDVHRLKIGDGVTRWNALDWIVADTSRTIEFADDFVIDVKNGGTGVQDFVTPGFLKADGQNDFTTVANIVENDILFSDNSTGNASTSTHGFLRKLNNDETYFLSGKGTWLIPQYMIPTGLGLSTSVSSSVVSLKVNYKSNLNETSISTSGYTLPLATGTLAGILSAEAQTIGGVKTFSSGIVGNLTGNADTATTIKTVVQSSVTDLNTFLDAGEYYISKNETQSVSHGPSNLSSDDGLILRVFNPIYSNGSDWGFKVIQFAIGSSSGNVYVRTITRANTSSEFTFNSWNQLNFTTNVDNILSGNTTFYGTKTFNSNIIGNLTGNADTASMLDFTSVDTSVTSKNLNDYITPGLYLFQNITANNLSNSPIPEEYTNTSYIKGFLEVFSINKSPTDSSSLVGFQRFTIHRYSSSDNKMSKTYIRGFHKVSTTNISGMTTANNFTPWKTFLDENDISSLETSVSNILDGTSTVEYANKLKSTVLSSNTISVNLNEVIEPGLYYGYYTTNPSGSGISHTNFPSDFTSGVMYYMYVNNYNYGIGTSHSYIIQRLYSKGSTDGVAYIRNLSYDGSTNPATTSGTWLKIATNSDISNILTGNITLSGTKTFSSNIVGNLTGNADTSSYLKPINITSSSGTTTYLNDYTSPGLYYFTGATSSDPAHSPIPSDLSNAAAGDPPAQNYIRLYLEVFKNNPSATYSIIGFQRATYHWYTSGNRSSVKTYIRGFCKVSNNSDPITFTSWKLILDETDISSLQSSVSNILDGSTTFAGTKTFSSDIIGNINTSTRLYRNDVSVTDESTANLNDYYIPGLYNFYYSTSSRLLNSPIFNTATGSHYIRGFLEVFSNSSNPTTTTSICGFQRFTYHGLSSAESTLKKFAKTYVRGFYKQTNEQFSNMTFTEWKSLLDQNDISSLETSISNLDTSVSNILDGTTTFAGSKTFSSTITGSITGNSGTTDRLKLRYIVGTSTSCDLNTIIEPGLHYGYYASSPNTGVTYSNFPDGFSTNNGNAYIYLYVDNYNYGTDGTNANQNGIIQRLYSKKSGDIYIRGLLYDSTQTPVYISANSWVKVAKSSEVSAVSSSLSTLSTGLSNVGVYPGAKTLTGDFSFNDQITQGLYYVSNASGNITNYPGDSKSLGFLQVIRTSGATYVLQIFTRAISSPTGSTTYYRYRKSSTSWTDWYRLVSDVDSTFIKDITFTASNTVVDLDTYKTQGVYGFVNSNVSASGSANFPTTVGGILLVFGNGGSNMSQIYIGASGGGMWYRGGDFTSSTSPAWKALIDGSRNTITKVDKSNVSQILLPNYTARSYEYCVYEFNSDNTFSNMYCGVKVGNEDMLGGSGSTSKLYKGWYRRVF